MTVDNRPALRRKIEELKRQKRAVILAHYYTTPDVQQVADFLGDSLALSVQAQQVDADIILFAGVHFMAETAKVLCPDKKVLIPCPEAGCSLAESCDAAEFAAFKARYPGYKVVSYVNTTVGVKALTDICCTSSNALKVVESLPADQPLIFAPDRNLGSYIQKLTGRRNMVLWNGACHVHEEFSLEKLLALKREHPAARVVAHPECRAYILEAADYVGSTAGILDYCGRSDAQEFIVVTEAGILAEMQRRYPDKHFIPAPPDDETCACNNCKYMKMVTLENIAECLEHESPEIELDEEVRRAAELTADNNCLGAAKLVVFCNAVEDNPFMAGAFHGPGEPDCCIHVGVSGPGAVRAALAKLPKDAPLQEVAELVKRTAFKITRMGQLVGELAAKELDVPFGIVDLSLAPTPAIGDSVARVLEEMGLACCGGYGTTAALALLNDAVKKGGVMASGSVGGLSGAFIPVSEDEGMIAAAESGVLSLHKLEAMTAVCSVGLDMIVIPGDTPADVISAMIADEAAIGMVNSKTTAVRVIPAIGKNMGERLDFGGLLGYGPVMPVNDSSPSVFVNRGGRIPAPLQSLKN